MALLIRLGGFGIINPSCQSTAHNNVSEMITACLELSSCSKYMSFHLTLRMSSSELRRTLAPSAFRELWRHPQRRAPRAVSLHYQPLSMVLPSTMEHSGMPSVYDMAGVCHTFLHIASVEAKSLLSSSCDRGNLCPIGGQT